MSTFDNATLMITGGTGSFGSTVLKHFLDSDLKMCIRDSSNSVLRSLTVNGSSLATAQQKVETALLYLGRLCPIRFTKR